MTEPNDNSTLSAIRKIVGPNGWLTREQDLTPFLTEARGLWRGECDMVVSPATTEEVKTIVRICADTGITITPQSGNTGLVGGSIPHGGIVLSTRRMNRIINIDPVDNNCRGRLYPRRDSECSK